MSATFISVLTAELLVFDGILKFFTAARSWGGGSTPPLPRQSLPKSLVALP